MLPEEAWLNSIDSIRELAQWGLKDGLLVDLEIEPHVYFILNSTDKAARMVEDIGMPNVFPNLDIGHFVINREAPHRIEKIKDKIIHVHLSETQGYEHTNSIHRHRDAWISPPTSTRRSSSASRRTASGWASPASPASRWAKRVTRWTTRTAG